MYNLNYNVTNARLNRPVGRPFIPQPRVDPYSASLVLAVPGAIFKNGYVNVFNQINAFDDISAYIKFGAVLDESTGKYISNSATHSMALITGSFATGSYTASSNVVAFSGYDQSIFFTGSKGVVASPDTGSTDGVNLSSTKPFVIEGWVAFTTSSAVVGNSMTSSGFPQRVLAQKYLEGGGFPFGSSSYLSIAGYGGPTVLDGPPSFPVSGSLIFYTNDDANPILEESFFPQSSSKFNALEWKHYAVSYTPPSGSEAKVVRLYINGTIVGRGNMIYGIDSAVNTPTFLFGDDGNALLPAQRPQVPGAYYQDFRMYNGTNKNYTGSQFPIPESMIIGSQEPYPQYNP